MMQMINDKDFRLIHAQGKQYGVGIAWVVFRTKSFPEEPAVFEKLEDAIEYIKGCAGLLPQGWSNMPQEIKIT